MEALGRYDGSLQMFVEEPRDADVARLRFLRWLVEHGRLEYTSVNSLPGEHTSEPSRSEHISGRRSLTMAQR
jgi:hypothetical protein